MYKLVMSNVHEGWQTSSRRTASVTNNSRQENEMTSALPARLPIWPFSSSVQSVDTLLAFTDNSLNHSQSLRVFRKT